jgi:transposase
MPGRLEEVQHLLPDELWAKVERVLPVATPTSIPSRSVLHGALIVLERGFPWGMLPRSYGLGSGQAIKRRLDQWRAAGVWQKVASLLKEHREAQGLAALELSRVER